MPHQDAADRDRTAASAVLVAAADLPPAHRATAEEFLAERFDQYVVTEVLIGTRSPLPDAALDVIDQAIADGLFRSVPRIVDGIRAIAGAMRCGTVDRDLAAHLHVAVEQHRAFVERMTEPLPTVPVGACLRITSLAKLETELGAIDLPEAEQKVVVAEWLRKNKPTDALIWSIKRRGWGDLLP